MAVCQLFNFGNRIQTVKQEAPVCLVEVNVRDVRVEGHWGKIIHRAGEYIFFTAILLNKWLRLLRVKEDFIGRHQQYSRDHTLVRQTEWRVWSWVCCILRNVLGIQNSITNSTFSPFCLWCNERIVWGRTSQLVPPPESIQMGEPIDIHFHQVKEPPPHPKRNE